MKKALLSTLALLMFAACQKDDTTLGGSMEGAAIEIETTINAANEVTRSGSTTYSGETLSLTVDYGSSDRYTSTDVKWTNNSSSWSAESDQLWKDSKTAPLLYAYAPYQDGVSNYAAIPFSAATDQSSGTESSDLVGYATDSYTPTSATLNIPFKHVMSQVVLNVTYDTSISEDDFTGIPTVSAVVGASYNATTATATASGSVVSIAPLTVLPSLVGDETSATRTYTAIVSPQTIASGATLLDLGAVGDKYLRYQPTEEMTLSGGYSYIFNLTITSTYDLALSSDIVVNDGWGESTDLGSGTLSRICDIFYNSDDGDSEYYEIYTAKGLQAFASIVNGGLSNDEVTALDTDDTITGEVAQNLSANGKLMVNIDLSGVCGANVGDDGGINWTPIGDSSNNYGGTFDGGGYLVSGLCIDDTSLTNQGLFGYIYDATISNLGVSGNVSAISQVGGIVGYAYSSTISECYNMADITGSTREIGGVVGYAYGSDISKCYNWGEISGGGANTGGVVGKIDTSSTVYSSYNCGEISGGDNTGGVVGYSSLSSITSCYNRADVSSQSYAGGVAGSISYTTIKCCYSSGEMKNYGSYNNVYGAVGYQQHSNTLISFCFYDKTVDSSVGSAVLGSNSTSTYYYFGLTTDEMTSDGTLLNYLTIENYGNSSDDWAADSADASLEINDGYPILKWQVATE